MKTQVLSGIGALMLILPALSLGISYADSGAWAVASDFRWALMVIGLFLLVAATLLHRRTGRDDDSGRRP